MSDQPEFNADDAVKAILQRGRLLWTHDHEAYFAIYGGEAFPVDSKDVKKLISSALPTISSKARGKVVAALRRHAVDAPVVTRNEFRSTSVGTDPDRLCLQYLGADVVLVFVLGEPDYPQLARNGAFGVLFTPAPASKPGSES